MLNSQTNLIDIGPWDANQTLHIFNLKYNQRNKNLNQGYGNAGTINHQSTLSNRHKHLSSDKLNQMRKNSQKQKVYRTLQNVLSTPYYRSQQKPKNSKRLINKTNFKLLSSYQKHQAKLNSMKNNQFTFSKNFTVKKRDRLSKLVNSRQDFYQDEVFVNLYDIQSPKNKNKMILPKISLSIMQ